jgi:hypothetical protein
LLLAGAVALVAVAAAAAATTHVFVVRADVAIGAYAVRRDGSLAGAVRVFGEPASRRHVFSLGDCRVVWPEHGPTIEFYNLGGQNACGPNGRFGRAYLRGRHWMTTKHLNVGESIRKLRRLYPNAPFRPGERRQ